MSQIRALAVGRIYDSRGKATIEAEITLDSGARARAGAPSGASTGAHEVAAFPKGGVPAALAAVRERLNPALVGVDAADQGAVDGTIHSVDGTADLSHLGGNSATAVSVAAAMAFAAEQGEPLWRVLARPGSMVARFPAIVGNCINGGRHAIGGPDIQEFIAYADDADPARSVEAALRVHTLIGEQLHHRYPTAALGRGDEGGWVAAIGNVEALEILVNACAQARDELHIPVHPGLDLAASEFFEAGQYRYKDRTLDTEGQIAFVSGLVDKYGIRYLEDPLDQEAFEGFATLTQAVGNRTLVVGDDIYVTNVEPASPRDRPRLLQRRADQGEPGRDVDRYTPDGRPRRFERSRDGRLPPFGGGPGVLADPRGRRDGRAGAQMRTSRRRAHGKAK